MVPAEEKGTPVPAQLGTAPTDAGEERAAYPRVRVVIDANSDIHHDIIRDDGADWTLTFNIELTRDCVMEYCVQYPNHITLQAWRELARGVAGATVGDADDDNGQMRVNGPLCILSTGTNARETTKMSATTSIPHAWIAAPLERALGEAVRRQLPFAARA